MMIDLVKLLPLMLRKAGDSEEVREHAVFAAWIVAVGASLRQISTPLKLERKTLIVAVTDSTWRTQLKRMQGHILFKLNSLLGAPVITTIEFVVNPDMIKAVPLLPPQEVHFVAPEEQAHALRKHANAIANPELRNAFLRAAGKCLDRRAR